MLNPRYREIFFHLRGPCVGFLAGVAPLLRPVSFWKLRLQLWYLSEIAMQGMVERREGLGFAPEARQPIGVAHHFGGQHLDGHRAVELRVRGPIHLAHAARAEWSCDLVGPEADSGGEAQ